jgi:hypothetical protein
VACPQFEKFTEARCAQPFLKGVRFEDDPFYLREQLVRDPLGRAETFDELLREVLNPRRVDIVEETRWEIGTSFACSARGFRLDQVWCSSGGQPIVDELVDGLVELAPCGGQWAAFGKFAG